MQRLSRQYTNILKNSSKMLQVLFLRNDKMRSVYVDEVETLNFGEIMKHLQRGESVFITGGKEGRLQTKPDAQSLQHAVQTLGTERDDVIEA